MPLSKKKLFAFGFSAIGINMMKLIIGTYLCNAVLTAGFETNAANWTYFNKDVVSTSVWAIIILVVKIINSVSDFPFTAFLDNLKVKIGKRRFGVLLGFGPLVLAFIMFLMPPSNDNLLLNTIWLGLFLILFYFAYSCVMLSYYASFSEVTKDDGDRRFLANIKSVADVVYYVLGFALIPVLVDFINIRIIALIFLPLSLLIIAGIFLVKDNPEQTVSDTREKSQGFIKSIVHTCKNKEYIRWMIVFAFMTFSIQLFLTGQSIFLDGTGGFSGGQIAIVNACAFGPVPVTMMLYNFIGKKKGFRFGFVYAMLTFAFAMGVCALANKNIIASSDIRFYIGMLSGLLCSLGIGAFFSVAYVVPSHLAAKEREETGYSKPSMYFAIQGLFGASVTGLATGPVLIGIRHFGLTHLMTVIVGISLILCCILTVILPKSVAMIGKENKEKARIPKKPENPDKNIAGEE